MQRVRCNVWMGLLVRPAGQTSWTDQLDGPVLFTLSLGQFAYSKIDLSVCTLSQLRSPTKALFRAEKNSEIKKCGYRQCWGTHFWILRSWRGSNWGYPIKKKFKKLWLDIFLKSLYKNTAKRNMSSAIYALSMYSRLCMKMSSFLFVRACAFVYLKIYSPKNVTINKYKSNLAR